jgi:hypothetical protein
VFRSPHCCGVGIGAICTQELRLARCTAPDGGGGLHAGICSTKGVPVQQPTTQFAKCALRARSDPARLACCRFNDARMFAASSTDEKAVVISESACCGGHPSPFQCFCRAMCSFCCRSCKLCCFHNLLDSLALPHLLHRVVSMSPRLMAHDAASKLLALAMARWSISQAMLDCT